MIINLVKLVFSKKAAEMFSLIIFKDEKFYWQIEALKIWFTFFPLNFLNLCGFKESLLELVKLT